MCGLLLFFRRVGCIVAAIHGALLSAEASKRGYNMQSISPASVLVNGAWLCREVILLETVVDTLEATVLVSVIDTYIVSSLVSALVVCVVTNKKTPLLSYAE